MNPNSQFQQYPQRDVNQSVFLYEGEFRVRAGDQCLAASGTAYLQWLPSPGIEVEIETSEPVGLNPTSLTVELPGFATKNVLAYSTNWGSTPSGQTRIGAHAGQIEWGAEQTALRSVGFQVVNFPDVITPGPLAVPGDPTADAGDYGGTIQTASLTYDGWRIRIVAVPQATDRYTQLKATGGYAFTHAGQLTRVDDTTFSVEQAKDILESVRVFLCFARGAACALPIQWGRDKDNEIVWRRFQSPIVDRWKRTYTSWFPETQGEILAQLFHAFCRFHQNPKLSEPLGVALHWYRHCNTQSSGLEGSLVLGMASLDLLGGLVVVDRYRSMLAEDYDLLPGAKKLRKLLSALKLQPVIPWRYQGLIRFARRNGGWDSCQALAELRNGFVHAKEKNRRVVFGQAGRAATPDALQLSLWYQELALLRVLDYRGSYHDRTTATWTHQVEPVPWEDP